MTMVSLAHRPLTERAREVLKRAGNPFRNYFARNPDDEVCSRYHVPELFAPERDLLHAIIDLYRYDPMTHSEVVPVLGNKGAGKTHLLHSIKHGAGGQWQLLVTPGVYQKDADFLEYLLFQIIDTMLGGGKQKGVRPLDYVGESLVRRQLGVALRSLNPTEKVDLFPPPGLGRIARRLGLGTQQASERADWLAENLSGYSNFARMPVPLTQALSEAGLTTQKAFDLIANHIARTEAHNTAGLMRRHIYTGFAKAVLLQDEAELASFLTYGFAELDFKVRPTRSDLVLALFKVFMEVFRSLKTPVVVAFDQLEDLLLARRSDDGHKTAEAFFAGIVQVMHQIDGLLFLIFAERGLWNRFVPSLDGYIQDRLNNPVHVPKHGTVKALRLEAPSEDLVRRVVEARLRPCLDELPTDEVITEITPFTDEQVMRVATTEPTLRDMLQQFRHLFDHIVYGPDDIHTETPRRVPTTVNSSMPDTEPETESEHSCTVPSNTSVDTGHSLVPVNRLANTELMEPIPDSPLPISVTPNLLNRMAQLLGHDESSEEPTTEVVKSVTLLQSPTEPLALPPVQEHAHATLEVESRDIVEQSPESQDLPTTEDRLTPENAVPEVPPTLFPVAGSESPIDVVKTNTLSHTALCELWDQEQRSARRKLEPEGAITGATRELQAGLGALLALCHEHGVKVGPWRLQHVVTEFSFGEHPTYGNVTFAHWACKDGQPWKVGIGLFLARGAGKPKDLEIKLSVMDMQPSMVDHLILLRPEDDLNLSGKSKSLMQDAERRGKHARMEPVSLDGFALMYSFPRWIAVVRESLPEGSPLPNLADVIQEQCEKLLPQLCMPVQM